MYRLQNLKNYLMLVDRGGGGGGGGEGLEVAVAVAVGRGWLPRIHIFKLVTVKDTKMTLFIVNYKAKQKA